MRLFLIGASLFLVLGLEAQTPFPLQQFGNGGAGRGVYTPTFHTAGRFPVLGNQGFQVVSRNLRGGAAGILLVGGTRMNLPLPGLTLYLDPTSSAQLFAQAKGQPGLAGDGEATIALPIPNQATLTGSEFVLQAFFLDTLSPPDLVHTQGLAGRICQTIDPNLTCLYDRSAYAQWVTGTAVGFALWQANTVPGFTYLKTQLFSAGSQSHYMVVVKHNTTGLEFVLVPGDSYRRGDLNQAAGNRHPYETPTHWVRIEPFLLARTEVTQGQFQQVMNQAPWQGRPLVYRGPNQTAHAASWIDWQEAEAFCLQAGLRLPTEAEWEYACRAGTKTVYQDGSNRATNLGQHAWYGIPWSSSQAYAQQVGAKLPNAFGLYDMHGNVQEWCRDRDHADYKGAPVNGDAWTWGGSAGRMLRGGGWDQDAAHCRSAYRIRDLPSARDAGYGFRPALSLHETHEVVLTEKFTDTRMFDPQASGGSWGGGKASPGIIGGSGILGAFHKEMFLGIKAVGGVLTIPTDQVKVKGTGTLTGQDVIVTNGIFEFGYFHVPAGLTLDFVGSSVPKIFVRGAARVEGTIKVNGQDAPSHDGSSSTRGTGGKANCGGATGGQGALQKGGGLDGGSLSFPQGSARYNSTAARACAGRGAPMFPTGSITYNGYDGWVCAQMAAGGSGGGNFIQGTKGYGRLTGTNPSLPQFVKTDVPPDNPPGTAFTYLPKLSTEASILQFLAGGSGGGGGGSSPIGSMKNYIQEWHTGQGGGGGGGALLVRAGGDLSIGTTGLLEARGGSSPTPQAYKRAMPGGGGSGGNILLQMGGAFLSQGKVHAPGGASGHYQEAASYNWDCHSYGGEGGSGYLRVEGIPAPMPAQLQGFDPPATSSNVGLLDDRDPVTGVQSRFYNPQRPKPVFSHYRIKAKENGLPVTYSDDPRIGKACRFDPGRGTAVSLFLQGAQLDGQGNPVPSTLTRWVTTSAELNDVKNWWGGKASAQPTAVRWILLFDRSILSGSASIDVEEVSITCR